MAVTSYRASISRYYFRSKPLLSSLPKSDLTFFKQYLKLKKVKKGRELFREGTYPKGVYILKRGKVKLYQETQHGSQQIVYVYAPGEMFGYRPLLCGEKHPASATTIEECGIYFLSVKHFQEALRKSASLSNILLQNLSHEFTVLVNRIAVFGQKSVKERVALSLLILREKYKKHEDSKVVEISLSRSDLAAFVGTTIETIARIITKLKTEKIIKVYGRKIIVHDPNALFDLVD